MKPEEARRILFSKFNSAEEAVDWFFSRLQKICLPTRVLGVSLQTTMLVATMMNTLFNSVLIELRVAFEVFKVNRAVIIELSFL